MEVLYVVLCFQGFHTVFEIQIFYHSNDTRNFRIVPFIGTQLHITHYNLKETNFITTQSDTIHPLKYTVKKYSSSGDILYQCYQCIFCPSGRRAHVIFFLYYW